MRHQVSQYKTVQNKTVQTGGQISMYCRQCGNPMPEDESFCMMCGTAVAKENESVVPEQEVQPSIYYYDPARQDLAGMPPPPVYPGYPEGGKTQSRSDKPKNKKKKLLVTLIVAGCVLALAVGIAVPVLIEKGRSERYEAAMALMDSQDYEAAKAAFIEMGGYKEAAGMAEECQDTIDYNDAKAQMGTGEYEQARDAFKALGGFSDSEELALECQNTLDYNAAKALLDSGDNEKAKEAFLTLGEFQDSAAMVTECQNRIDYAAAAALMDGKKFADAKIAFTALGSYSDASALALECQHNIDYIAADDAFKNGLFYTAYEGFSDLGNFSDAKDRAIKCIQPVPENGELYRNPDFGKKISFTIKNEDPNRAVCVKVYTEDNVLVSTVFIGPNSKTKIKLPSGSYRFKEGVGYDWFGDKEYFGGAGEYSIMQFEDGELQKLSSSRVYTLTLMIQDGSGNVGGTPETVDGF
jgi:outer membrane protein assembly factor BamD (BamD/ComL family)